MGRRPPLVAAQMSLLRSYTHFYNTLTIKVLLLGSVRLSDGAKMKSHLGIYSDWVEAASRQAEKYPLALPGEETRRQIRNTLGFSEAAPIAEHAKIENIWKRDGLIGEAISWSVGYGPRTQAWFLRPEGVDKPLPRLGIGRTWRRVEHLRLCWFNIIGTISCLPFRGWNLLTPGLPLTMNGWATPAATWDASMRGHISLIERCRRKRLPGYRRRFMASACLSCEK